ncbi:MAG: mechanosensitive ion channel family protein [Anditalea sp.]
MNEILERSFLNNTLLNYLIALGIILIGTLIIKVFKGPVVNKIRSFTEKTDTNIDDYIIDTIDRFGIPALYILLFSSALQYLTLAPRLSQLISILTIIVVTILIIRFISSTILMVLTRYVRQQEGGEEKVKQLYGIMVIINVFVWSVGILFLFDNLGYDVTAIIASLGIGGIAIALAAQNILGDLFNYFVIFFDRPFEVGDFVVIDDKNGVIEYVGLKTTRIKTLSGEQLIFSNSDLTSSRIHNYKKMQRRRVVFRIGVTYQTTHAQLKEIPDLIKSIISEHQNVSVDRVHFFLYSDSSLDFETVYYVESGDYNLYMDIQQFINLRVYEEFEKRGIDIAYPTRTLFINKEEEEETEKNDAPTLLVEGKKKT